MKTACWMNSCGCPKAKVNDHSQILSFILNCVSFSNLNLETNFDASFISSQLQIDEGDNFFLVSSQIYFYPNAGQKLRSV